MKSFILTIMLSGFISLSQAQNLQLNFNSTANLVFTADADDALVSVTGQVRKLTDSTTGANSNLPRVAGTNLRILGTESEYDDSNLIPASGVEVRFWQPDAPNVFLTAQTDESGNYSIGLSEGIWIGEACGSGHGFYPAAWDLLIENAKLKTMRAVARKNIELEFLFPSNLVGQHETVTLRGSGFGCNGSLVFTYSNSVDRCEVARPVEYQHESVRFDEFELRTDSELRFEMPELDSDRNVTRHVAFVHYEQGLGKSERIPIGESILASQADNSVLCEGESIGSETSTAVLQETIGSIIVQSDLAGESGNPQTGGGYAPDGLTSNDFGIQTHMSTDFQLNNTGAVQINVDIPGGF